LDCDRDGQEEILVGALATTVSTLGCFATDGRLVKSLELPDTPESMQAIDLDGDGLKEIAYVAGQLNGASLLGIWWPDRSNSVGVRIPEMTGRNQPVVLRRTADGGRDLALSFSSGRTYGLSASGKGWSVQLDPYPAGDVIAAVDVDGDGTDELITLRGAMLIAWSLKDLSASSAEVRSH
jgi:hypothetical protein